MRKFFIPVLFAISFLMPISSADAKDIKYPTQMMVENNVEIRKGALSSYPLVKTLTHGQQVTVIDEFINSMDEKWYRVDLGDILGWGKAENFSFNTTDLVGHSAKASESNVNVRKGATTAYQSIGKLKKDQIVKVIDSFFNNEGELWYRIEFGNQKGWVLAVYLLDANSSAPETPFLKTVQVQSVEIRKGATTSYPVVATLKKNQQVKIIDTFTHNNGEEWYRVDLGTLRGWVPSKAFVPPLQKTVQVNNAVVRKGASINYAIVANLKIYQKVDIIDEFTHSNGEKWFRLDLGNVKGWVPESIFIATPKITKTVQVDNAVVRKGASGKYDIVAVLKKNQKVEIIDEFTHKNGEKWFRLDLGNVKGWVPESTFIATPKIIKTVLINNAVVRKGASNNYAIVANLKIYQSVEIIDEFTHENGEKWFRLDLGNVKGWVPESTFIASSQKTQIVQANTAYVRRGASISYEVVAKVIKNQEVTIIDTFSHSNGELWYRIDLGTIKGWVPETVFHSQPGFKKETLIIVTKNAVLRSGASNSYRIVEKNIPYNSKVKAIDEFINPSTKQRWVRVTTPAGNTGWVLEYEVVRSTSEINYSFGLKKGVLRKSADENSDRIHTLSGDEKLLILDEVKNWYLVEDPEGYRGWLLRDYTAQTITKQLLSPTLLNDGSGETLVWKKSMNFKLNYVTLSNNRLKIFGGISHTVLPDFQIKGIKSIEYSNSEKAIFITFEPGYTFTTLNNEKTLTVKPIPTGIFGKRIIIDPGHGGHDPGAIGPSGLREKDVNLAIAKLLKSELEKAGAIVLLTRDQDYFLELNERTDIANNSNFDAFISIHCDSYTSTSKGTSTFYNDRVNFNGPKSILLGQAVQKHLVSSIGTTNRGVKEQEFYVNRMNELPSILVEVAFISNPSEEALLKLPAFHQKVAKGITNGFIEYFGKF